MVSYFTPTFKGWHSSSSLARRTKRWVLAGKEKRYSSGWDGAFPFFLFFPSQLLGWLSQLMDRFWAPTIFSVFCYFQPVQYNQIQPLAANFASPTTVKRTSRDTNSGLFIFSNQHHDVANTTWLCVVRCSISHGQQRQPRCWIWHEMKRQIPAWGRSPCLSAQPGDTSRH